MSERQRVVEITSEENWNQYSFGAEYGTQYFSECPVCLETRWVCTNADEDSKKRVAIVGEDPDNSMCSMCNAMHQRYPESSSYAFRVATAQMIRLRRQIEAGEIKVKQE